MAEIGFSGATSVHAIGGAGKPRAAFGTDTPAGWAMGIWALSVVIIAFFLLAL